MAGPGEDYMDAQLRVVQGLLGQVPQMAAAADEAAKRLVAGGSIHISTGSSAMSAELCGRAGGLCGLKPVGRDALPTLPPTDVALSCDYGAPIDYPIGQWRAAAKTGVLVIHVDARGVHDPGALPPTAHVIPVALPYGEKVAGLSGIQTLTPAMAIAHWTFVAELLGAGRRQGKQLAVYLSIHLDEGHKRFERTKGLLFEPDLKPEPVPPGQFARAFLGHVRAALEGLRRDEAANLRKAAAWLQEAKAQRRQRVDHLYGHLPPCVARSLGPDLFTETVTEPVGDKAIEWMRRKLHGGDVYLLVGYQQNEDAMAAAANALGARTIFITSLPPGPEQAKNPLHLYVNPHWPLTDACLDLPGYDVKACPLSGIMGLTVYYAICAEALAEK